MYWFVGWVICFIAGTVLHVIRKAVDIRGQSERHSTREIFECNSVSDNDTLVVYIAYRQIFEYFIDDIFIAVPLTELSATLSYAQFA